MLVQTLPLVLCGPILRRVDATSVSVFVALKFSRTVKLSLYNNSANKSFLQAAEATTLTFGKYLHAVVVTVKLNSPLQQNITYGYDLQFTRTAATAEDTGAAVEDLASQGLLNGTIAMLGYAPNQLPTFALPPDDLGSLRLIHASCRKPHGQGVDALPTVDTLIEKSLGDPLARPHQLLLTGDQIYADDVAQPLLHLLTETGNALLGWADEEVLPDVNRKASTLRPGERQVAMDLANFSTGEGTSHLLSLGEFYAMYLFAWSDVVWSEVPKFEQAFPAEAKELAELMKRDDIERDSGRYVELANKHSTFDQERLPLINYRNGLKQVRRLLANVPTYMMFDDHEVTDDWYIHREWTEGVLGCELGRRIIANALSAYAIFQAWGNEPLQEFAPTGNGGKLLSKLTQWRGINKDWKNNDSQRYAQADAIDRQIQEHLKISSSNSSTAVRWHYQIEYPSHHLVVLDTRTQRQFVGNNPKAQANLLSNAGIEQQIPLPANRNVPLTVLLSPPPVIGHPHFERQIQPTFRPVKKETGVDLEPWWVGGRLEAFESLLERLSARQRVLMLSGDVHYGYTVELRYWNDRQQPTQPAAFVQLVSSSLKNEDVKTHYMAWKALPEPEGYLGWSSPGNHLSKKGKAIRVEGTPAVQKVPAGDTEVTPAEWRYRIEFCRDIREGGDRDPSYKPIASSSDNVNYLAKNRAKALAQRQAAKSDQDRISVGTNNFGEVSFAVRDPFYYVLHTLWCRSKTNAEVLPRTVHTASLTIPMPEEMPPVPLTMAVYLPDLSDWADLLSFRPPTEVQQWVRQKNGTGNPWYIHRIEDGSGPINLDYYPVRVTRLPTQIPDSSQPPTARSLLQRVRLDLNQFVNNNVAQFEPNDEDEHQRWVTHPLTSIIHINMKMAILGLATNVDDGSVVVSAYTPESWIFSTIWTTRDFSHPVSGNRMFGYVQNPDGSYTFFTRGADRLTSPLDHLGARFAFDAANQLWLSLQQKLAAFVNANGGEATIEPAISDRHNWTQVSAKYYRPTTTWI